MHVNYRPLPVIQRQQCKDHERDNMWPVSFVLVDAYRSYLRRLLKKQLPVTNIAREKNMTRLNQIITSIRKTSKTDVLWWGSNTVIFVKNIL